MDYTATINEKKYTLVRASSPLSELTTPPLSPERSAMLEPDMRLLKQPRIVVTTRHTTFDGLGTSAALDGPRIVLMNGPTLPGGPSTQTASKRPFSAVDHDSEDEEVSDKRVRAQVIPAGACADDSEAADDMPGNKRNTKIVVVGRKTRVTRGSEATSQAEKTPSQPKQEIAPAKAAMMQAKKTTTETKQAAKKQSGPTVGVDDNIDYRPPPASKPQVWAYGRGSLCEALPYFRAYKGSLHSSKVVAQGFLIDHEVDYGDVFGTQVIISSV